MQINVSSRPQFVLWYLCHPFKNKLWLAMYLQCIVQLS